MKFHSKEFFYIYNDSAYNDKFDILYLFNTLLSVFVEKTFNKTMSNAKIVVENNFDFIRNF